MTSIELIHFLAAVHKHSRVHFSNGIKTDSLDAIKEISSMVNDPTWSITTTKVEGITTVHIQKQPTTNEN